MNPLDRLLIGCMLLAGLLVGGTLAVHRYGAEQRTAGYAAAVAAGQAQHDRDAAAALKKESDLRAQLHAKDDEAFTKEKTYAASLEAAQRRVRTGVDSLRCPTANPVPAGAAPADRPAAGGIEVDVAGPRLMPEAAADLLGIAGDVAGLVRRYERLEQRFDACREVNNGPAP